MVLKAPEALAMVTDRRSATDTATRLLSTALAERSQARPKTPPGPAGGVTRDLLRPRRSNRPYCRLQAHEFVQPAWRCARPISGLL